MCHCTCTYARSAYIFYAVSFWSVPYTVCIYNCTYIFCAIMFWSVIHANVCHYRCTMYIQYTFCAVIILYCHMYCMPCMTFKIIKRYYSIFLSLAVGKNLLYCYITVLYCKSREFFVIIYNYSEMWIRFAKDGFAKQKHKLYTGCRHWQKRCYLHAITTAFSVLKELSHENLCGYCYISIESSFQGL